MRARVRRDALGLLAPVMLLAAVSCAPISSGERSGSAAVPAVERPLVGAENLNATGWVQTSVEYRAAARQAYARATAMLDLALADRSWTAALEQAGSAFVDLLPAVILDVDETVLDNSYYQARLVLDGEAYDASTWDAWVAEAAATPVPGAVEFCLYAADSGVTVFYVTNRRAPLEAPTRANLAAFEFPLGTETDTLLMQDERPEWTGDKTTRRSFVAAGHRILLLIGDDMGDFVSDSRGSVSERRTVAEANDSAWGTRWIVLPNPQYGSWEGALFDFDYSLSRPEQLARVRGALDSKR